MTKSVLACLIFGCLTGAVSLTLVSAPPSEDGPRLVLFAPWQDGVTLVKRAGGQAVGPVQAPMGVLAFAPGGSDFDERLRAQGAWAVLDGAAFALICGVERPTQAKGHET